MSNRSSLYLIVMRGSSIGPRCVLAILTAGVALAQSASPTGTVGSGNPAETLHYSVDWRLIPAGTAVVTMMPNAPGTNQGYKADVRLTSSGCWTSCSTSTTCTTPITRVATVRVAIDA